MLRNVVFYWGVTHTVVGLTQRASLHRPWDISTFWEICVAGVLTFGACGLPLALIPWKSHNPKPWQTTLAGYGLGGLMAGIAASVVLYVLHRFHESGGISDLGFLIIVGVMLYLVFPILMLCVLGFRPCGRDQNPGKDGR